MPYIKQEIVEPVVSSKGNPNPLESEVILPGCGTTHALQLRANDTPVRLDANTTMPYIKQEIIEPVVSQTLPCHTLSQEMVEPGGSNPNPLESEVILPDCGTTQVLQLRANDIPVHLDANITIPYIKKEIIEPVVSKTLLYHTLNKEMVEPLVASKGNPNPLENKVILTDCGTTQALQFRANDTFVHLDANITIPYIKQEIVEPVVSQTRPCHSTLSQQMVEPVVSSKGNPNPLKNKVKLPDCGTTQTLKFGANHTPVHLDANITIPYIKQEIVEPVISQTLPCHTLSQEMVEPLVSSKGNPNPLENESILPDCGTTQALQFRVNDTPVRLDANITVPYIKQEIVEPVISQTLPCHTLSQDIVQPVISSEGNPNSIKNEVLLGDCVTTPVLKFRANDTPVRLDANITVPYIKQEIVDPDVSQTLPCHTLNREMVEPVLSNKGNPIPLKNKVILPDCGTTQALKFGANDTPVHLDANITVPYIKQEIVEPVVSQNLPCHTLGQDMVEPVISSEGNPNTLKNDVVLMDCGTTQALQFRANDTPVRLDTNITVPYIKQEIVEPVIAQTLPCHTLSGVKRSECDDGENALAGKRFKPLEDVNCTSNKLHKTSGELIPPQKIKVEDELEVVENEFHESPEAVISSLNQKRNSSLSETCLNPVTSKIVQSSSRWFMNSCASAVITQTDTTLASTSNKTVFTSTSAFSTACLPSTSALSTACLPSTSTTPVLISFNAQPSIPRTQYVSSLPIITAQKVPMILVPQWRPVARSNSGLIFNPSLPTQSNQSPSLATNLSFVANNLNNSSVPIRISYPSSNVNSSLPIQTVLNPTINSKFFYANLRPTLRLPAKPLSSTSYSSISSNVPIQKTTMLPTVSPVGESTIVTRSCTRQRQEAYLQRQQAIRFMQYEIMMAERKKWNLVKSRREF